MPTFTAASPITPIWQILNNWRWRTDKVTDLDGLAALTGMQLGDRADVSTGGAAFRYNGTIWVQQTTPTFTSTTQRDTEYAKASGAYRTAGALARVSGIIYRWSGSTWVVHQTDTEITFTPTVTAVAAVTGNTATWEAVSGRIFVRGAFVIGGAVSGNFTVSTPTSSPIASLNGSLRGSALLTDISPAAGYPGIVDMNSPINTARITCINANGTYAGAAGINSTAPFTWATGDRVEYMYDYAAV